MASRRHGVTLALDLLGEAAELGLDELAIDNAAEYRDGRPQNNVLLRYLDKLRMLADRDAETAFCSVLSDYLGSYAESYIGRGDLERMAREGDGSTATDV